VCVRAARAAAIRGERERRRVSRGATVARVRRGARAVPPASRPVSRRRRRQRVRRRRDHRRQPSHAGAPLTRSSNAQFTSPARRDEAVLSVSRQVV